MRGILRDLRLGLRLLGASPAFAVSCICTLVLGVLLNTAVFGVVNALWFGKLPFRDDHQVLVIRTVRPGAGSSGVSWSDYQSAAASAPALAGVAAFSPRGYTLVVPGPDASPEQSGGGMMSASTLPLLGYAPLLGRNFTPAEEASYAEADGPPVVLIGEGFWRLRLAADPAVIGRRLRLDGSPAVIVGVLPRSFRFLYAGQDIVAPISRDVARAPRTEPSLRVIARLNPGASLDAANRQLEAVSLRAAGPPRPGAVLRAAPYRRVVFAEAYKMYPVLLAAALLLLVLVCANLSNLFLARMASRAREIAIRAALGAGRSRVVRQIATEAAVPAAIGAALSMTLAVWMRHAIVARVPELSVFTIDWRVALYTLGAAMLAGLVFAAAPALEAARADVAGSLKSGGALQSRAGSRLRGALMAAQVAVSLTLIASTGLLLRSMANLRAVDKGLDLRGALSVSIEPRGARYADPAQRLRFWEALAVGVSATPGVEAVGVASAIPLTTTPGASTVEIEGRSAATAGSVRIALTTADPGYASAVRLRLVAGRALSAADRPPAPRVALVNEAFARRFWPDRPADAVGRRIRTAPGADWLTIAGVTADARQFLMFPAAPEIVVPLAQSPRDARALIVRAPGLPPAAVRAAVRRALRSVDPDVPAGDFLAEDDIVEMFYPKVMVLGLGVLAAVALGLAMLGLGGVISFLAARRSREFGVRIALGGTARSIALLVARQGLRVVAIGVAIGMAGAFALSRSLRFFLVDVPPFDPVPFLGAAAVVFAVALAALAAPALRASRTDPARTLRAE